MREQLFFPSHSSSEKRCGKWNRTKASLDGRKSEEGRASLVKLITPFPERLRLLSANSVPAKPLLNF